MSDSGLGTDRGDTVMISASLGVCAVAFVAAMAYLKVYTDEHGPINVSNGNKHVCEPSKASGSPSLKFK